MQCLITTLRESVSDANLLKLGEMPFKITSKEDSIAEMRLQARTNTTFELQIMGNGYFTDSTGSSNLGKSKTIPSSDTSYVYFSKGDYTVILKEKYNIRLIGVASDSIGGGNIEFDINNLIGTNPGTVYFQIPSLGVTGDLSAFTGFTDMFRVGFFGSNITGDIAALKDCINQYIDFRECKNVYGDIGSVAKGVTRALNCYKSTNIGGDLSSLSGCTNLTTLNLDSTKVTGDTSSLAGLTNLTIFDHTNTAITGTWPLV